MFSCSPAFHLVQWPFEAPRYPFFAPSKDNNELNIGTRVGGGSIEKREHKADHNHDHRNHTLPGC
jgi:hypothetical protein